MSYNDCRENSVEVDGVRIHYLTQGQGEPLVLVHGWPTHSYLWRHQIPGLAEQFCVYALDLPGFGRSDKLVDRRYSWDFYDDTLTGFLDRVGLGQVTLISHDLGGPISLLFAVRRPERLARLVVLDTMPYPDMPLMVRVLLSAVRLPGLGSAIVSKHGFRVMFRMGTVREGAITDDVLDVYYQPFVADRSAWLGLRRTLTEPDTDALTEIADNLGHITAPTLILWAENDITAPLSIARRLHADIRGSSLEAIPDCGHFLTEDRPDLVTEHLMGFLSR